MAKNMRLFDQEIRDKFEKLPMVKKAKQLAAKSFMLYPFELYENMKKPFDVKLEETKELILNHLKEYKKCYIASSYGMDSIVLMHIVISTARENNIETPEVWLNDTLNTYKEEKAYWTEINELFQIPPEKFHKFTPPKDEKGNPFTVWTIAKKYGHLPSFRRMHHEVKGDHGATSQRKVECCDVLKKASVNEFLKQQPKAERFDCHFVGTRAEESNIRRIGVLQRCRTYVTRYRKPYPIRTVTPLSFWTKSDIYEYYARFNIPKNPTYQIHKLERMGCASCPAHMGWEKRLASDPTNEGFGMLQQNLKILQETDLERFAESINELKKFLKVGHNDKEHEKRLVALLKRMTGEPILDDYV